MFRLIKKLEIDLAFIRSIGFSHPLSFPWFKIVKICRTFVVLVVVYPLSSYDAVIVDGTYTILLIQESGIVIDSELLLFVMNIGIEANEQDRCFEIEEDLDEMS